ncbi:extracellular solute-binding protein [Paenibacillus sp. FSL W8-0186]|uniref:Sugar ABC transporter substrate-binding protein n=1 Tax=Paenibacillus woosongensis TaxID=307580 RepID=A0ABQ4MX90_9BACL|nr:extracellular solute-binding protein [Paenibacillus woosongensis]GIP60550.1 sugar ABC transporter substrate-binding protein [Paenibacillus woosongensis]
MKKAFAVVMLAVLLTVTACSNQGESKKQAGVKELTMWSMETRSRDTIEQSIKEFNDTHPDIRLTAEFFEDEALKTKMKVAIAGNQLPDIITYWSGETFDTLVSTNMLGDITDKLAQDAEFKDNVLPGGLDTFTYEDKTYAIPVLFSGVSLWYNKEIFAENGLTPPATYDELLSVVDQLNAKDITPITIAGKERWPMLHWFSYLAQRVGGTEPFEKAKNGEADFTQDSFVQAGEMLRELAIDRKGFVNGFLGLDYAAAESLFVNERAAMYLQGEWAMEAFLNDEFAEKVGFVPFPAVDGGQGSINVYQGGFGVGMAISSKADQDAAYTAIRFLSSPEQRKEIYEGANISPMKNPGLDDSKMHPLAYEYDKSISDNLEGFFGYYDQTLDARRADQFLDLMGAIVGQSSNDVKEELAKIK